jgi:hypothetical protein
MYLQHMYPEPKSMTENESIRFTFGAKVKITLNREIKPAIADRMKQLWHRFCRTCGDLEIAVLNEPAKTFCAVIGTPESIALDSQDLYAINADGEGVYIAMSSEDALIPAFTTLVQLICPISLDDGNEEFYISSANIHDHPSIKFRSIHLCIFPESKLSTIEKAIHLAGFLKFTHVILEFWGTLQYETLPELAWEGHSFSKQQIKPLIDLINSYGMEAIPMLNHFGHAAQARSVYGRHTVLNRNLKLSKLFEPDGWTWCLSNPVTYKLLGELRSELCELFGEGKYFHLGFDEAYSFASCDICRKRVPHELLAEYLNNLCSDICDSGRRPIVWHDEFIRRADFSDKTKDHVVANGQSHDTDKALQLIDRRVIMADWQYEYIGNGNPTTPFFMEQGFDTILCPWDNLNNITALANDTRNFGAYGIMLTTWHHISDMMPKFFPAAERVWQSENHRGIQRGEAACILRTLYDTKGDYISSGWNDFEVTY